MNGCVFVGCEEEPQYKIFCRNHAVEVSVGLSKDRFHSSPTSPNVLFKSELDGEVHWCGNGHPLPSMPIVPRTYADWDYALQDGWSESGGIYFCPKCTRENWRPTCRVPECEELVLIIDRDAEEWASICPSHMVVVSDMVDRADYVGLTTLMKKNKAVKTARRLI